jgi:tetratricopeptide (TPR) repeat protein
VNRYLAVVFSDLVRHTDVWSRVPREKMVGIVAEYRYLAESAAGQYGALYREWAGDGHMFLFESVDTAVQFALKLIENWRIGSENLPALREFPRMPLRLGCHFGECTQLEGEEAWIGRGNAIAKRVESEADEDSLYVTESVLDLVDLPLYEVAQAGAFELKGDHLPRRSLFHISAFRQEVFDAKPREELTAEDWFRKGLAFIGTREEWSENEAECYREALALRADFAEAHMNYAILLRARAAFGEAARHYQEALRIRPAYAEAHYNYASLLAARGSLAGAAEHYDEALRMRPEYVDAHHGYATLLVARGHLDEARGHYEEALRLRPDYPEAHSNYAILLDQLEAPESAAEHYREALRLRPRYAEGHYNYALLLDGLGEALEAERHYREALRLSPDYAEAHNNLAVLLHLRGDLDGAERHYRHALEIRPDDPEGHYNLALVLRAKGKDKDAARHARIARGLAPEQPAFRSPIER